jgi:hypothetical protein
MSRCVRAGCEGGALAPRWALCAACTLPLLDPAQARPEFVVDQQSSAGWDALAWAERIARSRWGNAVDDDHWVTGIRCLSFATVATGRSQGCAHTGTPGSAVPIVAVAGAPGVLCCPQCAEPVVARHTMTGHACDRCTGTTVGPEQRVAALTGASLIIVGQLCDSCAATVLQFGFPGGVDGSESAPSDAR